MSRITKSLLGGIAISVSLLAVVDDGLAEELQSGWHQWRGSARDGLVGGPAWPNSISEGSLRENWAIQLPPSYSGPVLSQDAVFTTSTEDAQAEVVYAFDRKTGKKLWETKWQGSMTVPFYAAANGSWIRATPAYDGESLFVAGMRDVLVRINAKTGEIEWRVDFVEQLGAPLPKFGFVSSPLVDEEFVYAQAGSAFLKLGKQSGDIHWRVLENQSDPADSAFSSPLITTLAGKRQAVVQTRQKLAGVDLEDGRILWERNVPSFRGMNILTPVQFENAIFTSTYQNNSWLFEIVNSGNSYSVREAWSNNAQGYISTPVVIDGHAYLHLQNRRFTCIDLSNGKRTWTSQPFGSYCSMIGNGDRILALDQRGILLLLQANPERFELLDRRQISDQPTWAHLAIEGNELFVRQLNGLKAFQWNTSAEAE